MDIHRNNFVLFRGCCNGFGLRDNRRNTYLADGPQVKALIHYVSGIRFFNPGHKQYAPNGRSIAQCDACYSLIRIRAGMSLIRHLTEDHKLNTEAAYQTVAFIYKRLDAYIRLMRLPKEAV